MRTFFPLFLTLMTCWVNTYAQSDEMLAQARGLYASGKYTEAVATLDQIIETNENDFEAWLIKGDCLQKEDKFVAAIQAYEKAEKLDDQSAILLTNHGAAYLNLEQYTEADKKIKKALKINPELAEAHYFMGNLKYFGFNINAAIRSYDEAIRIRPGYRDALYMRAASYAELGKYPEALRDYETALEMDPTLTTAAYNIAIIYLQAEQYDKAAALLADIDPSSLPKASDYYFYLGEALYFAGDEEAACAEYIRAKDAGDTEAAEIHQRYCLNKEERKESLKTRTIRMAF